MPTTAKIIELRRQLAARFPAAHAVRPRQEETFPTGLPCLDEVGLPLGALTELVSPHHSAGSALLLRGLVTNLARTGRFLALIDGRDSFDPQSVGPAACGRLLWIRCRTVNESLQAADILLRDGNFPLVVIDLQFNPAPQFRRVGGTLWHRLQSLVAKTNAACLIMTPLPCVSSATVRMTVNSLFEVTALERPEDQLLEAVQLRVTRRRHGLAEEADHEQPRRELAG